MVSLDAPVEGEDGDSRGPMAVPAAEPSPDRHAAFKELEQNVAGELAALPDSIHARTRAYFELHLAWLTRTVEQGCAAGQLSWPDGAGALAILILSTLEGGSLVARAMQSRALALAGFEQVLALAAPPAGRGG